MNIIGLDVGDDFIIESDSDVVHHIIETPKFENIVPQKGLFLSLDISKNSTGITYIENGEKITGNIVLDEAKGPHKEVLLRRALKKDLLELVEGKNFDLIVVEDAYVGENASTVRLLFALNTAIDELILDGVCSCDKFLRVNNNTWKSWLYALDSQGVTKGLNDKEKIRICLEMIGIVYEGEGYQDRLDSTGMLVGYFLKGGKIDTKTGGIKKKKKVSLNDIEASYEEETGYLFYGRDDINRENIVFLDYNRISKKRMLELLNDNPEGVFVTENPIKIGNLGEILGLGILEEGGYFSFWVKPSKLKKYVVEE